MFKDFGRRLQRDIKRRADARMEANRLITMKVCAIIVTEEASVCVCVCLIGRSVCLSCVSRCVHPTHLLWPPGHTIQCI